MYQKKDHGAVVILTSKQPSEEVFLLLKGGCRHSSLVIVKTLPLAQELKFCQDLRAVVRMLCLIAHFFLVFTIVDHELVVFQTLHRMYRIDRFLLVLATIQNV